MTVQAPPRVRRNRSTTDREVALPNIRRFKTLDGASKSAKSMPSTRSVPRRHNSGGSVRDLLVKTMSGLSADSYSLRGSKKSLNDSESRGLTADETASYSFDETSSPGGSSPSKEVKPIRRIPSRHRSHDGGRFGSLVRNLSSRGHASFKLSSGANLFLNESNRGLDVDVDEYEETQRMSSSSDTDSDYSDVYKKPAVQVVPSSTRGRALESVPKLPSTARLSYKTLLLPTFVDPETESREQDYLRDSQASQQRLQCLRGATDTRDYVNLWKENRYCHRMFRHRATVDYPDATCLEVWDYPERMTISKTFAQMHSAAEAVAPWVYAACGGNTKNKVVCVYLERGVELMASVIGTWYAGCNVSCIDTKLGWDRLEFIVGDADAGLIITSPDLVGENPDNMPCNILNINAVLHNGDPVDNIHTNSAAPLWLNCRGVPEGVEVPQRGVVLDENIEDDDACVCIYTSGSTGNPKGVRLQYKAFSNYACIEQVMTLPSPADRIVQTQSLSFIAGFHECWRGLNSGATTVMANKGITGLGPDLELWLREQNITIMKAVPSLLRSMLVGDNKPNLPKMRLFHVGGEAVTQQLVDLFGHGRMFLNTYGSTESCSNCVIGFCTPGDKVCTIGKALPSFEAYVLTKPTDTEEATTGELYIGGMSLALDYLNLPEKTKEVFIDHPKYGRLYNTGDVVERRPESGNLVYKGRGDNQVKINGYRVELGEVEAKMNMIDIVKESAAVVVDNAIYTFITVTPGCTITLEEFKKKLTDLSLPFFALPSRLKVVETFPKTISGKLDRKVLKQQIIDEKEAAKNAGSKFDTNTAFGVIMSAFADILVTEVQPTDDFFNLGGDSARAGQCVGLIRHKGEAIDLPKISILDLYTHRTPQALYDHVCKLSNSEEAYVEDVFKHKRMDMEDEPNRRLFDIVSFLVAISLMFIDGIEVCWYFIIVWTSNFAIPVTSHSAVIVPPFSEINVVAARLFFVKIIFYLLWVALSILVKWTVMGRYREGRWAKYGPMHLRHWIVVRVTSHLPWRLIGGTGLSKWVMRALGAKIGKGTYTFFEPASGFPMNGFDLYELEDFASICMGAYVSPIYFTEDSMVCGKVSLGKGASLLPRSTVSGSVRLEEGAVLDTLSNTTDGMVLHPYEKWSGSPAKPTGRNEVPETEPEVRGFGEFLMTIAQILDVYIGYYIVLNISLIPRYFLLIILHNEGYTIVSPGAFVGTVILSIFFGSMALTFFSTMMVKTASFFFPSQPGSSHIYSWTTLVLWHKLFWFKSPQLMLNNTRFLQWFARACGMNLGDESHISHVKFCIPDLVTIGKHSFLANPTFLAVPYVYNSMFHVGTLTIGDDVLVGNNACFPIDTNVPSNTTIAVNTGAPPDDAEEGGVWVGYPPVKITNNVLTPFPKGTRMNESLLLISEVLIIFIPGTLWAVTILSWLYLYVFVLPFLPDSTGTIAKTFVGALLLVPLRAFWSITGGLLARFIQTGFRTTPVEYNVGYWNSLCYRWRIYNKIWAFFLVQMLIDDFSGSMWMNRIVNFLTMSEIEEDVLIVHHGLFKDHNYIRVRKGATINESCILRTHTFEDWRLKFGFVDIGPNTVVYPSSTIMFGTVTGENCTIVANSLVLKGDELADGTIMASIPAVPMKNREPVKNKDEDQFLTPGWLSDVETIVWV